MDNLTKAENVEEQIKKDLGALKRLGSVERSALVGQVASFWPISANLTELDIKGEPSINSGQPGTSSNTPNKPTVAPKKSESGQSSGSDTVLPGKIETR